MFLAYAKVGVILHLIYGKYYVDVFFSIDCITQIPLLRITELMLRLQVYSILANLALRVSVFRYCCVGIVCIG